MAAKPKSRSIQPIDPTDLGGIQPRADELITDETIGYLNTTGLNNKLLSDDDPLKDDFHKFLEDISNTPVVISNEDMDLSDGDSYFDDIDLSNNVTTRSRNLIITDDSFVSNPMWTNGLFNSAHMPICETYVDPIDLDVRVIKIGNEDMEFVRHDHAYEQSNIAKINSFGKVK